MKPNENIEEELEDIIEDIEDLSELSSDETLDEESEVEEEDEETSEEEEEETSEEEEEETVKEDTAADAYLIARRNKLAEGMHKEKIELPESEITSDAEFKEYAETVLKKAHGDKYDESTADKMVNDILSKTDGDYGAAVGMLTSGLGEEEIEEEAVIDVDASRIEALVDSEESLSEGFKEKASLIFETAVREKVASAKSLLESRYETLLSEETARIKENLEDQIDGYLTAMVENWAEENKVAIETSLRTEIAENFIASLKSVFVEHYVDVPEGKKDLYEAVEAENASLKSELETTKNITEALADRVDSLIKERIISEASADLALSQAHKLETLVEDVPFIDEESYREKIITIKEHWFNSQRDDEEFETLSEEDSRTYSTTETIVEGENYDDEELSFEMKNYLAALSRVNRAAGGKTNS